MRLHGVFILSREGFGGVLVSDDAAVYQGFTKSQKCWARWFDDSTDGTEIENDYRQSIGKQLEQFTLESVISEVNRVLSAGLQIPVSSLAAVGELCGLAWDQSRDSRGERAACGSMRVRQFIAASVPGPPADH